MERHYQSAVGHLPWRLHQVYITLAPDDQFELGKLVRGAYR
jgi:hypothetical protein